MKNSWIIYLASFVWEENAFRHRDLNDSK